MSIVQEIRCSNCGAPISFEPGEIIATCKYCGYTVVIETGKAFTFEHSMLLNKYDPMQIEEVVKSWMNTGFLKPPDLARKSRILEKSLIYIPFWIITAEAETTYKGIFERITPAVVKEGQIKKKYNWLILARKATEFPTKEYDVPLEGKIPYDFRKIEGYAKILNSEIDKDEALEQVRQKVKDDCLGRFGGVVPVAEEGGKGALYAFFTNSFEVCRGKWRLSRLEEIASKNGTGYVLEGKVLRHKERKDVVQGVLDFRASPEEDVVVALLSAGSNDRLDVGQAVEKRTREMVLLLDAPRNPISLGRTERILQVQFFFDKDIARSILEQIKKM